MVLVRSHVRRERLQLSDDAGERVREQDTDAQGCLHVLHVDAAQHLNVLGAEAECAADFFDRAHVVAALVVEVPDVFAIGLMRRAAQRADAVGEALPQPARYRARGGVTHDPPAGQPCCPLEDDRSRRGRSFIGATYRDLFDVVGREPGARPYRLLRTGPSSAAQWGCTAVVAGGVVERGLSRPEELALGGPRGPASAELLEARRGCARRSRGGVGRFPRGWRLDPAAGPRHFVAQLLAASPLEVAVGRPLRRSLEEPLEFAADARLRPRGL